MRQISVTKQHRKIPDFIITAIDSKIRIDILELFCFKSCSYSTIRRSICSVNGLVAYHLAILRKHFLITMDSDGLYFLTFRGSVVLRHIKAIKDSESFICDV